MTLDLLVELAWKSLICAGITLVALRLVKNRSPAERSWLAHLGLLATMVLPLTVVIVPEWQVEALKPVSQMSSSAAVAVDNAPEAPSSAAVITGAASAPHMSPNKLASWIYAGPAALLMLLLLFAVLRLQRLRRRADVLVDPRWATALAAAQKRLGFKHGTALLVSSELRSPISWGIVRPIILLDPKAAGDEAQAEAIIAHELTHVARLDWAKLLMGRLATAIFWFNPFVWVLAGKCHELCEEAVDDAVLRSNIRRTDYAALLIGSARHECSAVLIAANGVTGSGSLTRRVERILDVSRRRAAPQAPWLAACCVAALAVGGSVSALGPVRDEFPIPGAGPRLSLTGLPVQARTERTFPPAAHEARAVQAEPAAVAAAAPSPSFDTRAVTATPILGAALVEAASKGDRTTVDQLLDSGLGIDIVAPGDGTALIAAAQAGRADMVRLLLGRGANPNAAVEGDGTPLTAAASRGHIDIVRLLLDRGAHIEAGTASDENALIRASAAGHDDIVRLLIARGADVNSRKGVRTPLGMARAGGHQQIEQLLVTAGARE